jgi:hypothetical protein
MSKTQLHQVLAAEPVVMNQDKAVQAETEHLFKANSGAFRGSLQVTKTTYEDIPDNVQESRVVTTVPARLAYHLQNWSKATDLQLTKEQTNSSGTAKADLKIGDKTVTLSATALLQLAKRLNVLKSVLEYAPSRDSSKNWVSDPEYFPTGVFRTPTTSAGRPKDKKEVRAVPGTATDKHPAQVATFDVTINLGTVEQTFFSGELTSASKAELMQRINTLIADVDQARSLANCADIVDTHVATDITAHLLAGIN